MKSQISNMAKIQSLLFSLTFIAVGLMSIILFGKVTNLDCNRYQKNQITCQLESSGLLGKKLTEIKQIQGSEVKRRRSDDGDYTYRVLIKYENGETPLTDYYSSGRSEKYEQVEQINSFINNPEIPNLKVKNDKRWLAYPLGGIFIVIGVITLATTWIPN